MEFKKVCVRTKVLPVDHGWWIKTLEISKGKDWLFIVILNWIVFASFDHAKKVR